MCIVLIIFIAITKYPKRIYLYITLFKLFSASAPIIIIMLLHWTLFIIFMSSFSILRASRTPEVKTLLCIGDSITEGIGSSDPFYNYPSQLSRLLNGDTSYNGIHYDVINLGEKYCIFVLIICSC